MGFTTALGYTPSYSISMGGNDITSNFNDRAVSISIESYDGGGKGDKMSIALDDRDWAIALPNVGGGTATQLSISLGYLQSGLYDQGSFAVDEVTLSGPPRTMTVAGTSLGFTTAVKSPIITSYDGKTLGDIIDAIAQGAGVGSSVDAGLASQKVQYLHQHESAMHLLQELERRYDGLAKFSDGMLSFSARGSGNSASGQFLGGFTLTPEDFGSWAIHIRAITAFSTTRAAYWDKTIHQLQWLQSQVSGAAGANVPFMLKRAFNSKEEAQSNADSKMSSLNRSIVQGTVTLAKGHPGIRGGSPFIISGMRDGIDGSYVIKTATHTYVKDAGIITKLEFYTPGGDISFASEITDESQVDQSGIDAPVTGPGGLLGHN